MDFKGVASAIPFLFLETIPMLDYKGALQSMTVWAGAIVAVLGFLGIVTSEADLHQLAEHVGNLVQSVLGILVILGRIRANSQIRGFMR